MRKSIGYVFKDITCSLEGRVKTDAIIKEFSNAFDVVPHDRLLTKIAVNGVVVRAVMFWA
jgi:hypothetical protein